MARDAGNSRRRPQRYPPIADYGLISDCHSAALVSRTGSIDWCCMPRLDAGSVFGRLLDWKAGGFFSIEPPSARSEWFRTYLEDTMVLVTTIRTGGGEARILDCFTQPRQDPGREHRRLLRIIEGERGVVPLRVRIAPRFDYGEVKPWVRHHDVRAFSAIGGNDGLAITGDADLEVDDHDLVADLEARVGERIRLSLVFMRPEEIDAHPPETPNPEELDRLLEQTIDSWRRWADRLRLEGPYAPAARRSALVLRALSFGPTGAVAAAATTSLPESREGTRTWDYRYSWIRDSTFSVRSMAELGCESEADAFRRFVVRSAAGHVDDLQIVYGLGGERRIGEGELSHLEGYRGARPVRVGNQAAAQLQLDAYGELLDLAWRWHQRGHPPTDDDWRFLVELANAAATRWREPDAGIWEWRRPRHFVHSKAMCWVALERGLTLAREGMRKAPERRWRKARDEIRAAIDKDGYDRRRGVYVQIFRRRALDAALLLLPTVGFVDYEDERMVRTADAIRDELSEGGLLRRYRTADGQKGEEGAFLACSFWLAECYTRQGRLEEARETYDQAVATANGVGLFSEEYDPRRHEMLGNFPQGLTHLSHIAAAVALAARQGGAEESTLRGAAGG